MDKIKELQAEIERYKKWYKMLLDFEQKHNADWCRMYTECDNERDELRRENYRLKCKLSDLEFEMKFKK